MGCRKIGEHGYQRIGNGANKQVLTDANKQPVLKPVLEDKEPSHLVYHTEPTLLQWFKTLLESDGGEEITKIQMHSVQPFCVPFAQRNAGRGSCYKQVSCTSHIEQGLPNMYETDRNDDTVTWERKPKR